MKTCSKCSTQKSDTLFSWQNKAHTYRDSICRACRAQLCTLRRVPRNSFKPAVFPYNLRHDLYDNLSEIDAAYIAGIVDGEGCICSSYPKNHKAPLQIKVTMIHKPTIEWLAETIDGCLMGQLIAKIPNSRTRWTWTLKGVRSYALLRKIAPHMKTKSEEAAVALEFGETFFVPQSRGRVVPEIHAKRDILGQQLRDLKRKEWLV